MSENLEPWLPGTPCWVDLTAPDPEVAETFYSGLFGWQVEVLSGDFGVYRVARQGGRRVAGIGSPPPDQPMPATWTTYLATADADATAAAITSAGGTLHFAPVDVTDQGRMFLAADPTGATFGVWQSRLNTGSELANEPGSFTWNECMSTDFEAAKTFYGTVFGYSWYDLSGDGFSYASFAVEDRAVGGIGGLPADAGDLPSHWMAYFKVADCDASAAKVNDLGGSVQRKPWDTPFGRMVVVSDDQGAAFSLMADTQESLTRAAEQAGSS